MEYDTTLAQQAYDLAAKWDAARTNADPATTFNEEDIASFNSNQKVVFLQTLQSYTALPAAHIDLLGSIYRFAENTNAEIRLRFYEVALQDRASPTAKKYTPAALKWVVGADGSGVVKGRMKFCRPIFAATGEVEHSLAKKTFEDNMSSFHPIAQKLIAKDLHLV